MTRGGVILYLTIVLLLALSGAAERATAAPVGSGFTYQGQVQQSGIPTNGSCDFQFTLWDQAGSGDPPSGGMQIGGTEIVSSAPVTDGLFTVVLNDSSEFGATAFTGEDRWLEIRIRCPSGPSSYTTLSPRQKLTATPYALYAPSAGSAGEVSCTGCVSAGDIGTGAVTSDSIANGTIQVADLGFTVGTVTSITAGTGLSGGTITTTGTIGVNFGGSAGTVAEGDHNHFGEIWTGSSGGQTGLHVANFSSAPGSTGLVGAQGFLASTGGAAGSIMLPPAGVAGTSVDGNGVTGLSYSVAGAGVFGNATNGNGVEGRSENGAAVSGYTPNGIDGVYGQSDRSGFLVGGNGVHGVSHGSFSNGVRGESNLGRGVSGTSDSNVGVLGTSTSGRGVLGSSTSGNGVSASSGGSARNAAALRADNTNPSGGMAGYFTNDSNFATAHFANGGTGEVLYLENGGTDGGGSGGGDFIKCVNDPENDAQFRVLTSGEARSDVGFNTPAADFAEMLPAEAGLEPGDVLAIAADGQLARSSTPYQSNVVGVHSTNPGFVGGKPMDGETPGTVPLALVGVVPVKASAENGPVHPGDLLAASATPGHAMSAGPQPAVGTVIGKALGALESGTGVIRMVVTLQ